MSSYRANGNDLMSSTKPQGFRVLLFSKAQHQADSSKAPAGFRPLGGSCSLSMQLLWTLAPSSPPTQLSCSVSSWCILNIYHKSLRPQNRCKLQEYFLINVATTTVAGWAGWWWRSLSQLFLDERHGETMQTRNLLITAPQVIKKARHLTCCINSE